MRSRKHADRRFKHAARKLDRKPFTMDVIRQALESILMQARVLAREDLEMFSQFRNDYAHVVGWVIRYANERPYVIDRTVCKHFSGRIVENGTRRQIFKLLLGRDGFEDQVNAELRKMQLPAIRYAADFIASNNKRARFNRKPLGPYINVLDDLVRRLDEYLDVLMQELLAFEKDIQQTGIACSEATKNESFVRAKLIESLPKLKNFLEKRLACLRRAPPTLFSSARELNAAAINDGVVLFIEQYLRSVGGLSGRKVDETVELLQYIVRRLGIDEVSDTLLDHVYTDSIMVPGSPHATTRPISIATSSNEAHYKIWQTRLSNDLAVPMRSSERLEHNDNLLLALQKVGCSDGSRASTVESNLKSFLWKHRPKEGSVIHFQPRKKQEEGRSTQRATY